MRSERRSIRAWRRRALAWLVLAASALLAAPTMRESPAEEGLLEAWAAAQKERDPARGLAALRRALVALEDVGDPVKEQALLDSLSRKAAHPLVRDQARFRLARKVARAGRLEEAARLDDKLGLAREAWLIGPFDNTSGAAIRTPLAPESAPFDERRAFAGLGRKVRWQPIERSWREGAFLVGTKLQPSREVRALLALVVLSDRAQPAALRVGVSGQVVAVVGGEEVLQSEGSRPFALDQSAAGIWLRRGKNLILLRLGNVEGDLDVAIRLTAPDGGSLSGVRWSAAPDDLRAAANETRALGRRPPTIRDPVAEALSFVKREAPRVEALLVAADLEALLRFSDQRRRPTAREAWLEALIAEEEAALGRRSMAEKAARPTRLARAHVELAREIEGRDPTSARHHFERALDLDPRSAQALIGLGRLRAEQGLLYEARRFFCEARAVAPWSARVLREALSFEREHSQLFASVAEEVFALAERHPTEAILEVAADVARERGDVARALSYLERAHALNVANGAYFATRLEVLERALAEEGSARTASEEHLRLLEERLRHHPHAHHTAGEYARALFGRGQFERAQGFVEERIRRFPARPEPWALKAELALLAGDREAARQALAEALKLTPQDRELVALRRALAGGEDDLVKRYGLDPEALMDAPVLEGAHEAGAELLASTLAVRFFSNGLGQMVRDRVFRVHDPEKAAGLRAIRVSYADGREVVDVLVAQRIRKDGRKEAARAIEDEAPRGKQNGMYTDEHAKVIVFGELEPGDLLHVRTRKELVGQQNLFGDFFGFIEPAQLFLPIGTWRVFVEGPKERPLFWGGRGAPEPRIEEREATRVFEFALENVPRIEPEPRMPPFFELARFLSVSTYESWRDLGRWYAALIHEQLALDEELRRKAHEVVAGATSDEEKVRRLYEFVVKSTRYVGIELGIHGWKPYPVTEVFRRRYGDCKDKASLLVSMLEEVGVPARIALVRTADLGGLEGTPASMWAFNHAIAYVPGLDLFLDGTAERSGHRELPALDQGAMTLIVAPYGSDEESVLRVIPTDPAEKNLNTSSYDLRLTEDGALLLEGEERFRGVHNADQRRDLFDPATRRETLERHLSAVLPGAEVRKVEVSDLSLFAEEIAYRFSGVIPNRAVVHGQGAMTLPLSLYPHDLSGSYAQHSSREHDVWVLTPWRTRNVMRYRLPEGFVPKDLPQGGVVKSKHLRFVQRITPTEDGFIVDEDTALLSRRIPKEEYAEFRRAALEADAMMKRKVRLVREGRQR